MAEDIGAKITLQGEREFRDALKQIESGLKVNASALTLISAQYADNTKSVEALTAKNDALKDSLNTQKEKIDTIREALTASAQKYGEADKRTMNWQASLNIAEAELIKMDSELKKNNNELEQAQKSMEKYGQKTEEVTEKTSGFGEKINELVGSLGINLPAGAQEAIKALDGQKVSTLALVGATAALVTGFAKLTIETTKTAKEIINLSQTTGMSTDEYQKWDYVLKSVGYSMEQAQGDLSQLAEKAMDAKNGVGEGAEIFGKLKIKVKESNGELKSQEKLFGEVITKLQNMTNETERNAIASALLSTTGEKLVPILNMTGKELENAKNQAVEMGYVMSSDTLNSFDALGVSMQKFESQTTALKNSLAVVLLPVLTGFFEILNKIDPKMLATIAIIAGITVTAIAVVKAIGDITSVFSAMNPSVLKTTMIVVGVTAALIALAAIIAVIIGRGDELNQTMTNVGNSVGNMTNTVNNAGNRVQIGRNAKGTNNWRGGLTWVNEEGGEILDLPRGTRIIPHDVSMEMARSSNTQKEGDVYLTLNVKMNEVDEVYKLINVVKQLKQAGRVKAVMA